MRHRLAGVPADDAYGWAVGSGGLVLVVADGVGSVAGSGEAAQTAVRVASVAGAEALGCSATGSGGSERATGSGASEHSTGSGASERSMGGLDADSEPPAFEPSGSEPPASEPSGSEPPPSGLDAAELDRADLDAAVRRAVVAVGEALRDGPGATTLVVAAVALDGRGRVARVGDSTALVLGAGEWRELFSEADPDGGSMSTLTGALPAARPEVELADLLIGPGEALVLVTDGIGDPLRDGPGTVAPALGAALASAPTPLGLAWVVDFSRQGCHDDRTVLALWKGA
ncbi:MAG: protein phosphatase 2C domain-containing protein [Actinomycetota bacterium]|nr:protein phosphatase 2C domain-containing protein [Actinomycetota bacterium]